MQHSISDNLFESMPDTYDMHLKCPDIDLNTYRYINKIELSYSVMRRKRIYLDTMYWVRFRDVVLGRNRNPVHIELYSFLKEAYLRGVAICPISYSAVSELLNQDDEHTRSVTSRVMDELSGAVCIERPDYLFINEVNAFMHRVFFPQNDQHQPSDVAWTKVAFFVGQPTLSANILAADQLLAMQKCIEDGMSSLNVEKLVSRLGLNPRMKTGHRHDWFKEVTQQTTDKLNVEKTKIENLFSSFEEYMQSEVIGIVDSMQSSLGPVMERMIRETGYKKTLTDDQLFLCSEMLKRLLINAYKHGKVNSEVPQLYIWASLHALVRYDQQRKYKDNDYEDFRHAGSALPYCHVFLTEKSLTHMLKHPPADIEKKFNCAVFSHPAEALNHLKEITTAVAT